MVSSILIGGREFLSFPRREVYPVWIFSFLIGLLSFFPYLGR
jgi:hypothetical protein